MPDPTHRGGPALRFDGLVVRLGIKGIPSFNLNNYVYFSWGNKSTFKASTYCYTLWCSFLVLA